MGQIQFEDRTVGSSVYRRKKRGRRREIDREREGGREKEEERKREKEKEGEREGGRGKRRNTRRGTGKIIKERNSEDQEIETSSQRHPLRLFEVLRVAPRFSLRVRDQEETSI